MKKQHKKARNVRRKPLKAERKKPRTGPTWGMAELGSGALDIIKLAAKYGVEDTVALLGELQWDAEQGDETAAGIVAQHRVVLLTGIEAGDELAVAVMAAWGERPIPPEPDGEPAPLP